MNREEAFLTILDATAKMQFHVAGMLESKAVEAEKVRNWLILHIRDEAFARYDEQLKQTLDVHELLVEVIDGITKMESGLARNIEVVLNRTEADSGGGGFGEFFSSGDGGGDGDDS